MCEEEDETMRRIAMWSGPRNLSTALMRSFSSRQDCVVTDEPFYATYLAKTGFDHPGREEVLAIQSHDWREVAAQLAEGHSPVGCGIWYQKHMAQHMRAEMFAPWLDRLEHGFLIRHPARVIASYLKVFPCMTLAETGLPWQVRLYEYLQKQGENPPVVDAEDLNRQPENALRGLCRAFSIPWDAAMLRWPAGRHPQDGVWASYWYANTWRSTGFAPVADGQTALPNPAVPFLDEAVAMYHHLRSCSSNVIPQTTD